MTKNTVVDSSPLIVLIKSDLDFLLPELFDVVHIPNAVYEEILEGDKNDPARQKLPNLEWCTRSALITANPEVAQYDLGRGETEAITLALTLRDASVLIDDAAARSCAKSLGISSLGTGGLLILAKRLGFDWFIF